MYVQDIFFARDIVNIGMSRKEVIQVISDIVQVYSYFWADNHYYYLIWEEHLPNLKSNRRVIKSQEVTTEQSHICVSQHYHFHMIIGAEWEDLRQMNSPHDIFTCFAY